MPLMNIIVAALVLLVAYMWTAQGFFSALIHLLCTIAAGALAFALWEPLTYAFLLDAAPSYAWTVGLIVPYIVILVLLRVGTDKLITRDVKLPASIDFAGGGVAGLGSGIISAGILVIGVGFMPVGAEFMGHRKVQYDAAGNLIASNALWIPADTLTARLYETLSMGAFTAGDGALARRMPGVENQASLLRATYDDRGATVLTPDAFEIVGTYTVEASTLEELTSDGFNPRPDGSPWPQDIKRVDGDTPAASSVIRGFSVKFLAGSAEKSGQVVIGAGQARLICELADGTSEGFQPVAVVAQSSGREITASRYRFNAKDAFIGAAGGASDPVMSLEFVIPADATPLDLLIKQVRVPVADAPQPRAYSVAERDDAAYALELIERTDEAPTGERPDATSYAASEGDSGPVNGREPGELGVLLSRNLRGLTLSRQLRGSLNVNDDNLIVSGSHSFPTGDVVGNKVPQPLKVKGFSVRPGVSLLQVDVSINQRLSLLGRAVDAAQQVLPPVLTDTNSQIYEPVGFIFMGGDSVEIQYEPGRPVRSLSELPSLSSSRPGDKLFLLFQVTTGAQIKSFTLGQQVEVATFDPPIIVDR